jgi:hypothetical protein
MPRFFGSFFPNLESKDQGPLHMECEYNRTPYRRRFENYSGHEHHTASMQPRKYSEDIFNMKFGRTRRHLQKYSEACSTRLRRAWGLVRPRTTRLRTWYRLSRIRDRHVTYRIPLVTTCTESELVRTEGNYPSGTRVRL